MLILSIFEFPATATLPECLKDQSAEDKGDKGRQHQHNLSSNSVHEDAGGQISSKLDYRKRNTRWYEKVEELGQGEKNSHISAE